MNATLRYPILLLCLLATPAALTLAECKPDSTKVSQPRTAFGRLPIAALHVDEGGSAVTLNGERRSMLEGRLAVALCKWSAYTLAVTSAVNSREIRTTYVVDGSTYRPALYLQSTGVELQRRWRPTAIFHPIVALDVGTASASYRYSHRRDDGGWDDREEGRAAARYIKPSAGVEASLFKYMTTYLVVGERRTAALETPGVDRGALNGGYASFGFGFGKFR